MMRHWRREPRCTGGNGTKTGRPCGRPVSLRTVSRLLRVLEELAGRLEAPDVEVAGLVGREVDPAVLAPHRGAGVGFAVRELDERGAVRAEGEDVEATLALRVLGGD